MVVSRQVVPVTSLPETTCAGSAVEREAKSAERMRAENSIIADVDFSVSGYKLQQTDSWNRERLPRG